MGSFSSWSYTSRLTIWPVTFDEYNQIITGDAYSVDGAWIGGGDAVRGDDDIEFIPKATFFFELGDDQPTPERQWYIDRGEHTGERTDDAEPIKIIYEYDISQFEKGSLRDFKAIT